MAKRMTSLPSADQGTVRGAIVDERVAVKEAATVRARKGVVKIARDVMALGQNRMKEPVREPVKAVATVDVAHAGVAVGGGVQGEIGEIVQHQARDKDPASASALMQKANPSHWTRLPHLA